MCGRWLRRSRAGGPFCGRAGGQRGRRCARRYSRTGALPAGAGGKNPPKKSAIGAA